MCFFYKQKPAYGVRISDWSSDVFSSDLRLDSDRTLQTCTDGDHSACPGSHLCMFYQPGPREAAGRRGRLLWELGSDEAAKSSHLLSHALEWLALMLPIVWHRVPAAAERRTWAVRAPAASSPGPPRQRLLLRRGFTCRRSEEHTS